MGMATRELYNPLRTLWLKDLIIAMDFPILTKEQKEGYYPRFRILEI